VQEREKHQIGASRARRLELHRGHASIVRWHNGDLGRRAIVRGGNRFALAIGELHQLRGTVSRDHRNRAKTCRWGSAFGHYNPGTYRLAAQTDANLALSCPVLVDIDAALLGMGNQRALEQDGLIGARLPTARPWDGRPGLRGDLQGELPGAYFGVQVRV